MANQIAIVCVSGAHEKLQMAAMIASVGAATGDEVSVFFSMNSLEYFIKERDTAPPAEGKFGTLLDKPGVPPFKQLFQQAVEFGEAKLLPCSMAMDLLAITADDLEPEFSEPVGLTKFLSDTQDAQLLSF